MPPAGFMEKIYQGVLDESVFRSFQKARETERVHRLVADYNALLKEYPPSHLEETGRVPGPALEKMGEAGLFGFSIPQAHGGLGFSLGEYLKTIEGMAETDLSVALVSIAHLSIGTKGIVLFGTEAQKQKYLPPAASGEMIFAYALTEPETGSDAKHIETFARLSQDGSHYVLNGRKTYITNANYAGGLTVFAQLDPGRPGHMGAFIVETDREGVEIGRDMPKMGLKASSTAAIRFKNVRVPVENLLGRPGDGFRIAMTVLNYGRLGVGAASAGMMQQSLRDMSKRASSRIQFGVPIGRFPLVQEKIARARVHHFVLSAMDAFTAAMLENHPLANTAIETSHCKLFGTTRAWDVLYDALQVAGGSGFLSTQPYEKRMRDFRVTPIFEGTTEIHSIYPALFALRRMTKGKGADRNPLPSLLASLHKHLSPFSKWPLPAEDPVMRRAARLARRNARTIGRLLLSGSLLHGKRIGQKELLLRRITTLSLYTYGLLAVLAKMEADRRRGELHSDEREMLDYFVEEAAQARRESKRLADSRRERLTAGLSGFSH